MYSPSIQNYPSNSPGVFPLGLEVVSPASGAHSLPQDCPENPGKMGRSPASRRFVWKLFVIIFPLCSLVEWPFEGIAANSPISDTHTHPYGGTAGDYPTISNKHGDLPHQTCLDVNFTREDWTCLGYRFTRCGMKIGHIPQHLDII